MGDDFTAAGTQLRRRSADPQPPAALAGGASATRRWPRRTTSKTRNWSPRKSVCSIGCRITFRDRAWRCFLASEAVFFVGLIAAFIYYHYVPSYRADAHKALDTLRTALYSVALFSSSFTIWRAEVNAKAGNIRRLHGWLLATILLGAAFIAFQVIEFVGLTNRGIVISSSMFSSVFLHVVGIHGMHVAAGLIMLTVLYGLLFASACCHNPGDRWRHWRSTGISWTSSGS